MNPGQRLQSLMATNALLVVPGCYDGLSAKLAHAAGFPIGFMSGFAVSGAKLGLPDVGLISFAEMADQLRAVCSAAPELLVIADGDTGYGNAVNVGRTVREFARAGAACVMIEDQVSPKRCGHTPGKTVVGRAEARMRARAAVDAARGSGVLVLARTDARSTLGLAEAIDRCNDFAAEGVDVVFLEAPESVSEMREACRRVAAPMLANMVIGGRTPVLPVEQLADFGYRLVLYPLIPFAAAIGAVRSAYAALRGGSADLSGGVSFDEVKAVVGFPDYYESEQRYATSE